MGAIIRTSVFFFSFFLSNCWRFKQATPPILGILVKLFPFNKLTLKPHICTVVTVMGKQFWSQAVLVRQFGAVVF